MALLLGQMVTGATIRTYHLSVPDNPPQATVPAILVFHGGGQDVETIASHWGIDPANPGIPPLSPLDEYLLVFPEADSRLNDHWVHFHKSDSAFPTHDLLFVEQLVTLITGAVYATPNGDVTVDSALVYAAGFSSGAGMVWQLMNHAISSTFKGFAAVGQALDPEKSEHYRRELAPGVPDPFATIYVHGTADPSFRSPTTLREVPLETTLPANTVREMLERNLIPPGTPAVTWLVPAPSMNTTEVVIQEFQGGTEAFEYVTVINGGHNWPTLSTVGNPPVATHFNATDEIIRFWNVHAGLPI